jgi:hypothetical protein
LHRCIDNRTSIDPDHGLILDVVMMELLKRRFSRQSAGNFAPAHWKLGVVDMTGNAIKPSVARQTKRLLDGLEQRRIGDGIMKGLAGACSAGDEYAAEQVIAHQVVVTSITP